MSSIEQTHFIASKVFAFQVPPLNSSEGYKASTWPKTPLWTGTLRVVSKNDKVSVLLEHTDKEGLFASCLVQSEKTVEQTVDSSRYFVLRVSDGKGRSAVLGIGFNDRTQAFDFKVAVQDQLSSNKDEPIQTIPSQDFSIPQGGKIHINLGSKLKKKDDGSKSSSSSSGGLKLAPPPSGSATSTATSADSSKKKKKKDEQPANTPDDWVTF